MRTRAVVLVAVVAVAFGLSRASVAKVRVSDPPARSGSDSLNANPPCGGVAAGSPKVYGVGTTTIDVSFTDGAGDTSLGCFQVVVLNAAGSQLGGVVQLTDDQATTARTLSAPLPVPQACRGGATCTVALRQLVNDAGGCPSAPSQPGAGALATFYSCGDFAIAQPEPPDAGSDAGPPPAPPSASPTVIPLPEEDAGVRIAGLRPEDAEANSCAATRGAGAAGASGLGGLALALTLGLVARRVRRVRRVEGRV